MILISKYLHYYDLNEEIGFNKAVKKRNLMSIHGALGLTDSLRIGFISIKRFRVTLEDEWN